MSEFLYLYNPVEPATWFYLSSLLMIGLFFKFSRFWSVRNLDLMLLMLLGPGLLLVHYGKELVERPEVVASQLSTASNETDSQIDADVSDSDSDSSGDDSAAAEAASDESVEESAGSKIAQAGRRAQKYGYIWLLGVGGLILARLLSDPTMVRRPLLEPNLSAGGLTFIGCSLFVFLMANVISEPIEEPSAEAELTATSDVAAEANTTQLEREGPGYVLMDKLPVSALKTLAIFAHFAIVMGMVLIGYWHFDNIIMGIGAATLYLMLPYTANHTHELKHALPAACLVWAVLFYRRPLAAGCFIGLAGGMTYYPLFLLPLWLSFYWPRGLVRFVSGVVSVLVVLTFVLISSSLMSSSDVLWNIQLMFGILPPAMTGLGGLWDESLNGWSSYYRIPVLAGFIALSSSLAIWPAQKNLGTLLSCSAAVMVATQFWHGYGGGMYMAWYLPLLLLTIFRPNLEDRVALTVLGEGWLPRRLSVLPTGRAAVV